MKVRWAVPKDSAFSGELGTPNIGGARDLAKQGDLRYDNLNGIAQSFVRTWWRGSAPSERHAWIAMELIVPRGILTLSTLEQALVEQTMHRQ